MPDDLISLEQAVEHSLRWVVARYLGEKKQLAEALGVSESTQ